MGLRPHPQAARYPCSAAAACTGPRSSVMASLARHTGAALRQVGRPAARDTPASGELEPVSRQPEGQPLGSRATLYRRPHESDPTCASQVRPPPAVATDSGMSTRRSTADPASLSSPIAEARREGIRAAFAMCSKAPPTSERLRRPSARFPGVGGTVPLLASARASPSCAPGERSARSHPRSGSRS